MFEIGNQQALVKLIFALEPDALASLTAFRINLVIMVNTKVHLITHDLGKSGRGSFVLDNVLRETISPLVMTL